MRMIVISIMILGSASMAFGQQADPSKSANTPWTLDQRCAVMGAHPGNQGSLTAACLAAGQGRPYLNQAPGYHPAQSQVQHSVIQPYRQTPPRDTRE